jgi:hypothetical protein
MSFNSLPKVLCTPNVEILILGTPQYIDVMHVIEFQTAYILSHGASLICTYAGSSFYELPYELSVYNVIG